MKDEAIYVRVPKSLREELEQARKKMSKDAGAEVLTSAAIRAALAAGLKEIKKGKRAA